MKLFITGGAGFIGSHFIRYILETYPEDAVVNFDKLTYAGNLKNLDEVSKKFVSRYSFVQGDIADKASVENALGISKPDAIINFAAESHVDRSIVDADAFINTNVVGVYNLLEATRKRGIGRFVQISTDEVYGEILQGAFAETTPLSPRSPYAASKAAGDLLALAHFTTYGTPLVITRSANAYGSHQYPEKLIPLSVTNLLEGKKIPIYGDGMQVRHWTHVLDHASGIDTALRRGVRGEVYNLSSDDQKEYTNMDVAFLIRKAFNKDESWLEHVKDRLAHDRRYRVDSSKLRSLGWKSHYSFEESIGEVIQWYKEHQDWWKPLKMNK